MRRHAPAPQQFPWIVMSDGSFLTPSDIVGSSSPPRIPTLPSNARCIGSTDSWLLLDCTDNVGLMHNYFLHNPFTNTTLPLPELDAVIGDVSELFKVLKLLMRSTPCDIIAVMTNNWNYPIILIQPGKGVWLPTPQTAPFVYITDIAFLGGKLYGITEAEDLVYLPIDFDSDGIPSITNVKRLIRHPPGNYPYGAWRDVNDNIECMHSDKGKKDEVKNEDCEVHALDELRKKTGDDMICDSETCWLDDEHKYLVTVIRYLVESRGKLLMVKRQLHWPSHSPNFSPDSLNFTRKVEVYEADVNKGAHWVPVSGGLDNQALFVSRFFCKSIPTSEDLDRDALHFIDTGEKFDMKSQIISPTWRDIGREEPMWIFSQELVV
jgi:hypothetical protein